MTKVMAFGTFSLIHPGHLYYLEKAKSMGDELIVVIARDRTVEKIKKKKPVPEQQRKKVVEALKPVDKAILGSLEDKYQVMEEQQPDLVVLGPDQEDQEKLKHELKKRGLNPKIVRISKRKGSLYQTTALLKYLCSHRSWNQ